MLTALYLLLSTTAVLANLQAVTWERGAHVEVQLKGDWYEAQIIEVKGDSYKIHYARSVSSWDEWVDQARIRAAAIRHDNPAQSQDTYVAFTQIIELLKQSGVMEDAGKIDEAVSLAERALRSAEKDLGPEHGTVALSLDALAWLSERKEDYTRAESYYQRELVIAEKPSSGLELSHLGILLGSIGRLHDLRGDYVGAEALYKHALDIQERTLGPEHPYVASTLDSLGELYQTEGDYEHAEQLLQRALAIREKAGGPEDLFVAGSLKSLASVYEAKGDYDKAELLLQRAVTIFEKSQGADSPYITGALNNLAMLYKDKGDYIRAEQLYQRAIAIEEKAHGPEHISLAHPLDNLAIVYQLKGDYKRAEALYKRALAIEEQALRPEDPDIATTLSNLANVYQEQRHYEPAEALLRRALAIKEKVLGPTHPEVATLLDNLSTLYYDKGDYEKAEPLSQRSLTIKEKALGPEHPGVAIALNNLAALIEKKGDYKGAETLYVRALSIYEKKLGPKHPYTVFTLQNLSSLSATQGDMSQAIAYLTRSTEISEYHAALILTTGSEEQKRAYLATLASETDYTISLHLHSAPHDLRAARLALSTILRRKGRALDAMTEQLSALRRRSDPQDRALLEQLVAARSRLATLVLNGTGERTSDTEKQGAVAKLEAEVQRLEAAVSARSAEFRAQSQPVTIESVQAAIPTDAALVEIASYRLFNAQAKNRAEHYGAARYAAYVLRGEGEPQWVDLGDAAPINSDVDALRKALLSPQSKDVKQVGQALYGKVMRPILRLLGDTHRLFLSPDGELNLIPFGALTDERGQYLVENYSITYLTSGRDLLRLQVHTSSKQGPIVFANPLFEQVSDTKKQPAPVTDANDRGRRSDDLANARFSPLPGTAEEAKALGNVLSGVKVLTGAQATEAALKQVSGPSILHIATHGFFLPDQVQAGAEPGNGRGLRLTTSAQTQPGGGENPLLRSGLALAGVNQRQSGAGEDGVLTALEAAGLDLWGTKLVVLSACETGLGEVKNGEGVYGLRRALVLAGSESQVMSLWQVSDDATRDLMVAYYQRLQAGEGRTEALREVQLEMLHGAKQGQGGQQRGLQTEIGGKEMKQDWGHPFYWASFIQSGEWSSLDGKDKQPGMRVP
jgi:CHAT domain-containing protein/Tfp pilus assembly protein PilF